MWSGYLRSGLRASLAVLAFAAAGACASAPGTSRWLTPAMLEELRLQQEYGDLLVARYAGMVGDSAAAAIYYGRAFSNAPDDPELLELATFASMAAGDIAGAIKVARGADRDVAADAPSAQLALVIADIGAGRTKEALARLSNPGVGVYNTDLQGALGAWLTAQSSSETDAALEIVDWITPVGAMRGDREIVRALVLMAGKRDAEALAAFEGARTYNVSAPDPVFTLAAELAASRGETGRARAMVSGLRGPAPAASVMLEGLASGKTFARPSLSSQKGAALIVHLVSSGGRARLHPETNLMRQASALYLDPDLAAARLAQADALEAQDRGEDAIRSLGLVKPGSPWRADAQMQSAETLFRMDRADEAAAMVAEASRSTRRDILGRAADFHGVTGDPAQAVALYDRIIAADAAGGMTDWQVLYARAMALNAAGDWPGAEAGLVEALEIEPDQPELLNSLGYNWVDRGENVEEGMALIRRAVAARPDLGHIVDSYGWAFYRLGDYAQAIPYLERAAELMPNSAEVVDHLGDAYWRAGREKEARYAWSAALRLDDGGVREASLRQKLSGGLPAAASRSLAARP
jgi:tetratricopeptide (TPR) repeat protein